MTITQLEKRIVWIALVFVLLLFGFAALAISTFHVGLPTCLTSVKPFQKGELITHSPTHYELHYYLLQLVVLRRARRVSAGNPSF